MNTTTTKRGAKEWHPFKHILDPKVQLEDGEELGLCLDHVANVCTKPCSDRITGKGEHRDCRCLNSLEGDAEKQRAVAKYMVAFVAKPRQERHTIIMEWLRYTTTTKEKACFFIPFVADDNNKNGDEEEEEETDNDGENMLHELKNYMVCKDAISILLDYGRCKWKTCAKAVKNNSLPVHGNIGKVSNNAKKFEREVKDDLHAFFHDMNQFATPKATRFVRETTGSGLRDGEENVLELPTCWSKRALYARFCFERGYVISSTATGIIKKEKRTDEQWDPQNEKTICSWTRFLSFWRLHYPLIRIAMASHDICTECHTFFNRSKYRVSGAVDADVEDNDTTSNNSLYCTDTGTSTMAEDAPEMPGDNLEMHDVPQDLQLETQPALTEREAILSKATLHVQQAMIQRKLANTTIQKAIDTHDLPHSERHYCFIADFAQNMELPFFGASQPGDTYYFSPLKINVFGIVDCSIFGGKLSAHVYDEGIGKKGGNNVTSMLVNEFKRLNIMRENETGKELTVIMDNCAGQNKNRMVLRLATYLVEAEYFEKVSFVFYIVGHTKNACDRWFNMLKKTYRRSNIYSFEQLTKSMETHNNINVTVTKASDFQDWDRFWDSIYKRFVGGTVHSTHIFSASKENKTTLLFRADDLPDTAVKSQNLMKKGTDTPNRLALLKSPQLDVIEAPGIPPIKQVELFSKYRALIPEEFRDTTCPEPSDDIKNKIKSERNTKQRERAKTKRETGQNKKHKSEDEKGNRTKQEAQECNKPESNRKHNNNNNNE